MCSLLLVRLPVLFCWSVARYLVRHVYFVLCLTVDRLCGLVVSASGYRMQMYCDSCEVRNEFIYVM
jgi:hypothetical protein